MGCNCGGAASGKFYLVTRADNTRVVVNSDTAARLTVTMAGGGTWRQVNPDQQRQLAAEGVPFV